MLTGLLKCLRSTRPLACGNHSLLLFRSFYTRSQPQITTADPTATQSASSAVCQAVFDTDGLVEIILVSLPTRNIFRAIKVLRTFKSVICSPPSLQEKLFLRLVTKLGQTSLPKSAYQCRLLRIPSTSRPESNFSTRAVLKPMLHLKLIHGNHTPSFKPRI